MEGERAVIYANNNLVGSHMHSLKVATAITSNQIIIHLILEYFFKITSGKKLIKESI